MKVVTVGTGMASVEFVQRLRLEGFDGPITMVGDEKFPPYSPCVIPFFLAGEPLETVYWKGVDFYERHGVSACLGDPVVEVDTERRLVTTAAGKHESYDRLFYAAGARSWYPKPEWLEARGVFGFKNLTDMLAIDRYVRDNNITSAVVFGGGLIGVDAALALWRRGLKITLVHRDAHVLSQITDEDGGQFATNKLKEKTGIRVRLKTTVDEIITNSGQLTGVNFSNGDSMETTLLIVSVGVSPNSEPITGHNKGVAVSAQMLADPAIYCAGDVAITPHAVSGSNGIYATYPNAMAQAHTAARHLVHGDGAYPGSINTNVLKKHLNFPIISAGSFSGEAITWHQGDIWRRVYLQEGRINGYLIIGDTRMSGYIYQLYRTQKLVDRNIKAIFSSPRHDSYYREMLATDTRRTQ